MYNDLRNYTPEKIVFAIDEDTAELFPTTLDFKDIEGAGHTLQEQMKFIGRYFSAFYPDNEVVDRRLDAFEVSNIREEYCILTEDEAPKRRKELEEAIEQAKQIKKKAEEAYNAVLMEIAKYASEVKVGIKEMRLRSKSTFAIAIAGFYLYYTWDKNDNVFRLAKATPVLDNTEIWSHDEKNRESMLELFGVEFPEITPSQEEDDGLPM